MQKFYLAFSNITPNSVLFLTSVVPSAPLTNTWNCCLPSEICTGARMLPPEDTRRGAKSIGSGAVAPQ